MTADGPVHGGGDEEARERCPWEPSATCKWGDACADCDRYRHFPERERREAIRESNQRAGGDLYGG